MNGLRIAFAIAVLTLALAGCSGRGAWWVGQWKGDRQIPVPPGGDPAVGRTLSTVDLKINTDGTFELKDAGIPMRGEVRFGADEARLRVLTVLDRPVASMGRGDERRDTPIVLKRQPDGSVTYQDTFGNAGPPVQLLRQPKQTNKP